MLKSIIDLLKVYDSYGEDELIDFAKGSKKAPENWKEFRQTIKQVRNAKQ